MVMGVEQTAVRLQKGDCKRMTEPIKVCRMCHKILSNHSFHMLGSQKTLVESHGRGKEKSLFGRTTRTQI